MAFEIGLLFDNRYTLIEKIGIGGFSEVWKAKDTFADGLQIALKIYAPDKGMDSQGIHQFKKEYALMLDIRHQNILTASHFSIYKERPYLVLPFCEGGSVHNLIYKKTQLSEPEIAKVLKQVCSGLAYLHQQNIIHQDLKPDNVLIDKNGNYLLTDFGISSRLRSTLRKNTQSSKALTAAYAPPERFSAQQLSHFNGDIFSLGVMIYEMATGDVPWMGMGGSVVRADSELPELPSQYSRSLNRLMQNCLQFKPEDRITAENLALEAAFFEKNGFWNFKKDNDFVERPSQVQNSARKTMLYDKRQESPNANVKNQSKEYTKAKVADVKPQLHTRTTGFFTKRWQVYNGKFKSIIWLSIGYFIMLVLGMLIPEAETTSYGPGETMYVSNDDYFAQWYAMSFYGTYVSFYIAFFLRFIIHNKVAKNIFSIPYFIIWMAWWAREKSTYINNDDIDLAVIAILPFFLFASLISISSFIYYIVFWIRHIFGKRPQVT